MRVEMYMTTGVGCARKCVTATYAGVRVVLEYICRLLSSSSAHKPVE